MNRQEILQTLDIPSVTSFTVLHAMCHDPESLEAVLSLAIARGELKGRMDTVCNYNRIFRGVRGAGEPVPDESVTANLPKENFSGSDLPTSGVTSAIYSPVGYVL